MDLIIHRLAAKEYIAARAWYQRQSALAAERLDDDLDQTFDRIRTIPNGGAIYLTHFRWVHLERYPYVIYYRVMNDALVRIHAIAHERRRPKYWTRRKF